MYYNCNIPVFFFGPSVNLLGLLYIFLTLYFSLFAFLSSPSLVVMHTSQDD